jgi:hypothetical protein
MTSQASSVTHHRSIVTRACKLCYHITNHRSDCLQETKGQSEPRNLDEKMTLILLAGFTL